MPAASGWMIARLRSSLWICRIISRCCLRFISCHRSRVARQFASLASWAPSHRLVFMLAFPTLNSTWLGPVGETFPVSPAGSGLSFFKECPPPSIQSPTPEPCLTSGRNAPKRMRLSLSSQVVPQILTAPAQPTGTIELSRKVSGSYNHASGLTGGPCLTRTGLLPHGRT
jgi:hypothetical protein